MSGFTNREISYFYFLHDFQLALSSLTFLVEDLDLEKKYSKKELRRLKAFHDAIIIAYNRPFSSTKYKLELNIFNPSKEQQELHNVLKEQRDKVVAHSDFNHMKIRIETINPFDDSSLVMPTSNFVEGLFFAEQLPEIESWLHVLIYHLSKMTFKISQSKGEIMYKKDNLSVVTHNIQN